jgi:hypothetical protein
MIRSRHLAVVAALGTSCLLGMTSCSSSDAPGGSTPAGGGGAGGATPSGSAGQSVAGATPAGGGSNVAGSDTGGAPSAGAPSGGTSGAGTAGAAGSAGASNGGTSGAGTAGAAGMLGLGGGTHTMPTCTKNTPEPNPTRASECDYLLQSLDFEDTLGYATTPSQIKTTAFGQAFGLFAINSCSPYCYSKNLTVGVDIVGGNMAQTQGEIIVEFPTTTGSGLPITAADANRNILAWITFDGAAKPPFEIDTQLVIETTTGIVPAKETKTLFKTGGNLNPFGPFNVMNDYSYSNGSEFKYFNAAGANGFPVTPMNVTGMGFRIVAKATAGQEWHGVAYIDHLQIRAGSPANPPGQYPYGLN